MKKILAALLLAGVGSANAAWVAVWSEQGGGTIYIENATMLFSGPVTPGTNPFIRAWIYTDYSSAINSDRVCHPSGGDCQWKRLNVMGQFDFSCNNVIRLVTIDEQWDSGPTSESYDPRGGYKIPDPRPHVAAPQPTPRGSQFNITGDRSLLTVQTAVCAAWPRR